ncbi:hypothetical protein K492DRAFT_174794 [Lichtheimia hyalospora FSU 10163]|nr:hypothetical protein K492DRAFT_174794 [Lichtheimia hyalospora FSU 10163]
MMQVILTPYWNAATIHFKYSSYPWTPKAQIWAYHFLVYVVSSLKVVPWMNHASMDGG